MNEQVQSELKKIFNGRFSTSESTRANYARGEDTYDPVLSQAVVFPETNEEVSQILKLCNEHKIPVVPFGTGTSLEGNAVGNSNGITISLEKMNTSNNARFEGQHTDLDGLDCLFETQQFSTVCVFGELRNTSFFFS